MEKTCENNGNNENKSSLSCDDITANKIKSNYNSINFLDNEIVVPNNEDEALVKPMLKTYVKKFKDKLSFNLNKYRRNLISVSNSFQRGLKAQTESFKNNLKDISDSFKMRFNEHFIENREVLIPLVHDLYEMNLNNIDAQLNVLREQMFSFLQTGSNDILKNIDELSTTCKEELKSFISFESKEYQTNINEPLIKFKDDMNSLLINLSKKIMNIFNSYQNDICSLMNSFENEMTEIIRFGNGKNIENHICKT